jgi:iron complex transport system substrate-binding protein
VTRLYWRRSALPQSQTEGRFLLAGKPDLPQRRKEHGGAQRKPFLVFLCESRRSLRLCGVLLLLLFTSCQDDRPAAGPLVVVDDAGDTVALAAPAERVVSLVPATTEILFAIGAGPKMVGRTRWDDYPAEASQVPDVGDGINPNIEAIVGQRPDLVVMYLSGSNAGAAERLRQLGIATVQLTVDRLSDVGRIARLLGDLTGQRAHGDSVAITTEQAIFRVSVPPDSSGPRILIVAWDQPPMAIGGGSFLSELVERAGAVNLFGDLTVPSAQVSIEAIVARNPDALLVSSDGPPAIASRPEWRVVPAVRENRFIHVTSSAFSRPSPRAADAIVELKTKLAKFPR